MSHFARIDENGYVVQVIVAEQDYIDSLDDRLMWKQCSYNSRGGVHYDPDTGMPSGKPHFRFNFPGIGYRYHPGYDAFVPPKPYNSWILDPTTCHWKPPIEMPKDGKAYTWDEIKRKWKEG